MKNRKKMICSTRAIKNARHIQKIASTLSSKEKGKEITSTIPIETLQKLHTIGNLHEVIKDKEIAEELSKNRPPKPSDSTSGPLFKGTLRIVKINFKNTGNGSTSMNDGDIQIIQNYLNRAIKPLSQYVSQYGQSNITVSNDIINFDVDLAGNSSYTGDDLKGWVGSIVNSNNLGKDSCPIILNPPGVSNSNGSGQILGYHDIQGEVPYCFCNISGSGLTIDDQQQAFAEVITHEVAEMAVDPNVDGSNPEVCDACAGNCDNNWIAFFDKNDQFMTALNSPPDAFNPPQDYAYYTATVVATNFPLDPNSDESCLLNNSDQQKACAYNPASPQA